MRKAIRVVLGLAIAGGLVLMAPRGFAQGRGAGTMSDEAMTLWSIHEANQNERDVATLAKEKSKSQTVKDVSAKFLDDSRDTDAQIRAYAKKRQIDLDALALQTNREMDDALAGERRSRSIGSATGEYAFTSENVIKTRR